MQNTVNAVDKYRELILTAERKIWSIAETGYKEFRTNEYLIKEFEKLGYTLTKAEDITGFYTVVDTGRPGPEVLILAELDSVICPSHNDANPETGAVHSCGHNAQCATLLGIAAALTENEVTEKLCGRVRLCAVPAEELLEIEYRSRLKNEGKIKYYDGKSEFLHRGYFDNVDMAFMVHASTNFYIGRGAVGCIAKSIIYKGVAAHAGGAPWDGKNALYAANCGINAVNAIRETFKESDIIRFHPIITSGGDMVNAIPETVRLESFVRGKSFEAIVDANKKVNMALIGAAISLDTNIEIIDIPGYAPLYNDDGMMKIAEDAAAVIMPELNLKATEIVTSGSTDMGALSCIMPVVHPYAAGAKGKNHGDDYEIADSEKACVINAKWQLAMLTLLLQDNAVRAKEILKSFKPMFSKEEYLRFVDSLNDSGNRITYTERKAEIRL